MVYCLKSCIVHNSSILGVRLLGAFDDILGVNPTLGVLLKILTGVKSPILDDSSAPRGKMELRNDEDSSSSLNASLKSKSYPRFLSFSSYLRSNGVFSGLLAV